MGWVHNTAKWHRNLTADGLFNNRPRGELDRVIIRHPGLVDRQFVFGARLRVQKVVVALQVGVQRSLIQALDTRIGCIDIKQLIDIAHTQIVLGLSICSDAIILSKKIERGIKVIAEQCPGCPIAAVGSQEIPSESIAPAIEVVLDVERPGRLHTRTFYSEVELGYVRDGDRWDGLPRQLQFRNGQGGQGNRGEPIISKLTVLVFRC